MLSDYLAKRNVKKENYYRLNVEVGVGEFGMNEWNRLVDISTNTRRYLSKPEVQGMTLDAASKLARIERMHRRLASRSGAGSTFPDSQQQSAPQLPPAPPAAIVVAPPSNPMAIELPADEIPASHRVNIPAHPPRGSDEKIAIMGPDELGHESHLVSPVTDMNAPRRSSEYLHSASSGSPRRSGELETNIPPPLPPKTPIPYPDDGVSPGITMPLPGAAPRPLQAPLGGYRPPYPVDGPPVVDKLRKPTYNVR